MQSRRALALAIAALSGCAHRPPHRPGDERLAGIDIEGNRRLSDKTLVTGLALHRVERRGGAADPYLVQIDAERIRGEYLRKGFLDIDVRPRVERKGDDARVIYTVEEGPRATTRVVVTGLPPEVSVKDVRDQLPLKDGRPFDYEPYDLAKPYLLAAVQNAGYARARLDASIVADRSTHVATVALAYTSGPKCRFGEVEVTGATGELATAVRERLAFAPGQVYSTQAITQTQRNLYGFGRFSTVQVQPEQGTSDVVGVKIAVAESARRQVQLGGGFGIEPTNYEVRGRAGYSIAGWPFPLDTVTLDLRPAYAYQREQGTYQPRIRALAQFERADLFWTYTKTQAEAGYNYLQVEAFTSYGPLARLGFETPIVTSRVQLRAGWRIQQASFRDVNSLIDSQPELRHRLGLDRSERIAGFEQKLVLDLRDHPIEPSFGAYGELHLTEGTRFAGSQYDYVETVADLRGYLPLPFGVVLAARGRYGEIRGDVPATERLFSGGAVSQRGFSERQLSPIATPPIDPTTMAIPTRSVPYGGAGLVETSIEARVPITTIRKMPLGVVGFLDGGDVTETPGELDLSNLHWAAGGGLRLMTPIGPVRLDVGYRLNRTGFTPAGRPEPEPGSQFAYHLTIGEAF